MRLAELINPTLAMLVKNAFKDFIVIVDDGHGWLTAGKRSFDGSLRENEFNAAVEDKLTMLLGFCGIESRRQWERESIMKQRRDDIDGNHNSGAH